MISDRLMAHLIVYEMHLVSAIPPPSAPQNPIKLIRFALINEPRAGQAQNIYENSRAAQFVSICTTV